MSAEGRQACYGAAPATDAGCCSFYLDVGIVSDVAASPQIITFGALASTAFSALMGVMACGKVLQAIARDNLLPALDFFAQGTEHSDTPTCKRTRRSDERAER